MIRLAAAALSIIAALAMPAAAQAQLRPQDASRLDRFEQIAGEALLEAFAGGAPEDVAALSTALSGAPQVAIDETLAGDWRCRTLKLGGMEPLVVYTDFACRMTLRLDGILFEKVGGSQRSSGVIAYRDGRAAYIGVGHVAGHTPPAYADLPENFEPTPEIWTDVAIFERAGPDRARLMFPAPANESDFDILELYR